MKLKNTVRNETLRTTVTKETTALNRKKSRIRKVVNNIIGNIKNLEKPIVLSQTRLTKLKTPRPHAWKNVNLIANIMSQQTK